MGVNVLSFLHMFFCCITFWCGYYSRVSFLWEDGLDKVHTSDTVTTVSSKRSLSVLLAAMEISCTTRTAPMLLVTVVRKYLHMCACVTYTSHGYYLRVAFIPLRAFDCAATIRGQGTIFESRGLFKGRGLLKGRGLFKGVYSNKYNMP